MRKLAVIGSSDLAKQIAHYAPTCGYKVVGYFDDFKEKGNQDGINILGKIEEAKSVFTAKVYDEIIVGIGYRHFLFRAEVFEKVTALGIPFARLIHPSCIMDKSATVGKGSVIYPGCILDQHVVVKENVLINLGCIISHDSVINSHCFLSPSVNVAGFCNVGEQCNLGINTTLIDHISICDHVQTGGSTLVIRNIEKPGVSVGVPAIKSK